MTSGSQRGTVRAIVPPGRSTRTSSPSAWMSAGTCSRISAATTRSNSPSANGSDSASPSLTSASAPAGTSPASSIATNRSRTPDSSSASWSKACRSAPHPMSSTRSPGRSPRRSKSTVSTGGPLDHVLVGGGSGLGDRAPAEALQRPDPAGRAHRRTALGVVEQRGDRGAQLVDVAGLDEVGAEAVGTDNLGDGTGTADHQWRLAGHQLGGRQREALVERRHAGQLGGAHHLD